MNDSTQQRLQTIREREQKATKGPWLWDGSDTEADEPYIFTDRSHVAPKSVSVLFNADWGTNEDADFIAHSREDLPFLLDLVASLQAERERLQKSVRHYEDRIEEEVYNACEWAATANIAEAERERYKKALEEARFCLNGTEKVSRFSSGDNNSVVRGEYCVMTLEQFDRLRSALSPPSDE